MIRRNEDVTAYDKKYLLSEIEQTKSALYSAYSNFENVVDPDLIDCCIYELKAVQTRYKFLLEQAKQADLQISGFRVMP